MEGETTSFPRCWLQIDSTNNASLWLPIRKEHVFRNKINVIFFFLIHGTSNPHGNLAFQLKTNDLRAILRGFHRFHSSDMIFSLPILLTFSAMSQYLKMSCFGFSGSFPGRYIDAQCLSGDIKRCIREAIRV